jgi:S-methyl-5-thioribose-1-phosphate isomerase
MTTSEKNKKNTRAVWFDGETVFMIDQIRLPFEKHIVALGDYKATIKAIKDMLTRGAGSIGAAAGFAMAQAATNANGDYETYIRRAKAEIESARPTAKDLFTATERIFRAALQSPQNAVKEAQAFADEIVEAAYSIGVYGNKILPSKASVLTHCNAGRLAIVDHGSATAPIYEASRNGKSIHVYVDETRPRAQGARLTAYELHEAGIPHTVIPDNAAAWLMASGKIDFVITGADRIAANGDTANKIGTLEKAIAAKYYGIPFYVAAPFSTFDYDTKNGREITIEERNHNEVRLQEGPDSEGKIRSIQVVSPGSPVLNPAFDISPAELITGFISPKGIFNVSEMQKIKQYVK